MAGDWYILATIPNFFERGMVAPHDIYSPRPAGDIRDVAPPKLARPRIDC